MKTKTQIIALLSANTKTIERELGLKIRNEQYVQGIKATLRWLIS